MSQFMYHQPQFPHSSYVPDNDDGDDDDKVKLFETKKIKEK